MSFFIKSLFPTTLPSLVKTTKEKKCNAVEDSLVWFSVVFV